MILKEKKVKRRKGTNGENRITLLIFLNFLSINRNMIIIWNKDNKQEYVD